MTEIFYVKGLPRDYEADVRSVKMHKTELAATLSLVAVVALEFFFMCRGIRTGSVPLIGAGLVGFVGLGVGCYGRKRLHDRHIKVRTEKGIEDEVFARNGLARNTLLKGLGSLGVRVEIYKRCRNRHADGYVPL